MNNIEVNSSPDATWQKMCQAAKKVQGFHEISDHMEAGGVAAAVLSESGKIYTGVCVDTACTLGVCAERNALFNMITNGETKILRVLAVMSDGKNGAPCGACREFMWQLNNSKDIKVVLYNEGTVIKLEDLMPHPY